MNLNCNNYYTLMYMDVVVKLYRYYYITYHFPNIKRPTLRFTYPLSPTHRNIDRYIHIVDSILSPQAPIKSS